MSSDVLHVSMGGSPSHPREWNPHGQERTAAPTHPAPALHLLRQRHAGRRGQHPFGPLHTRVREGLPGNFHVQKDFHQNFKDPEIKRSVWKSKFFTSVNLNIIPTKGSIMQKKQKDSKATEIRIGIMPTLWWTVMWPVPWCTWHHFPSGKMEIIMMPTPLYWKATHFILY